MRYFLISSRRFSFRHFLLCALLFLSEKILALGPTIEQQSTSSPSAPASASALASALESSSPPEEAKIPVHLESAKKDTGGNSSWLRMVGSLVIVGFLGIGTFVFIKRIRKADRSSSLAPEIKILAQHYFGPKKFLVIICLAGETMLLGVTENNINLIKSLTLLDEDLPDEVPKNFNNLISGEERSLAKNSPNSLEQDEELLNDEVSISGIKDVVTSRLKNMRIL